MYSKQLQYHYLYIIILFTLHSHIAMVEAKGQHIQCWCCLLHKQKYSYWSVTWRGRFCNKQATPSKWVSDKCNDSPGREWWWSCSLFGSSWSRLDNLDTHLLGWPTRVRHIFTFSILHKARYCTTLLSFSSCLFLNLMKTIIINYGVIKSFL